MDENSIRVKKADAKSKQTPKADEKPIVEEAVVSEPKPKAKFKAKAMPVKESVRKNEKKSAKEPLNIWGNRGKK